jgi:hypothetical protein
MAIAPTLKDTGIGPFIAEKGKWLIAFRTFSAREEAVTGAPIQNNQKLFAAVAANSIVRPNRVPKAR